MDAELVVDPLKNIDETRLVYLLFRFEATNFEIFDVKSNIVSLRCPIVAFYAILCLKAC